VGNNNNLAYAAAMAVAESPAKTYNPLFLYGGSGLGKTHLLHAIANFIHQNNSKYKRIMYMTSEKFTNELVSSIKTETNDAFREKYRRVDLLLVDDIQFLAGRERTQEEFFHTFNVLYDSEKQIVLTSDRLPSEIPQLEERLRTRFSMGLIADVQPPDYETRVAILRNKIENEYLSIDDEILEYVAENVKSNVRDLEGAVKRMLAYAGIHRTKKVTMGLAMQALKDIADSTPKREITVKLIIEIVEKYYRVSRGSLVSHKRSKDLTFPRQVAMYIARELTNESLPAIGQEFDGRDHTTVMHAINKIKSEMQTNEELKVAIDEIITNVNRN
jgi:chromosomal replication initiator protein